MSRALQDPSGLAEAFLRERRKKTGISYPRWAHDAIEAAALGATDSHDAALRVGAAFSAEIEPLERYVRAMREYAAAWYTHRAWRDVQTRLAWRCRIRSFEVRKPCTAKDQHALISAHADRIADQLADEIFGHPSGR